MIRLFLLTLVLSGCATTPCEQNISAQVVFPPYHGEARTEAHDYLDDYLDETVDVSSYGNAEEAAAKCAVELNYCKDWIHSVIGD